MGVEIGGKGRECTIDNIRIREERGDKACRRRSPYIMVGLQETL